MDTATSFFAAYSPLYLLISLAWLATDRLILRYRLTAEQWYRVRVPSLALHEAAHFFAALLLFASPKVTMGLMPDGRGGYLGGRVDCSPPLLGNFGNAIICAAPLALLGAGIWIWHNKLGVPQPFLAGLGWLVLTYWCLEAVTAISREDIAGMGVYAIVPLWGFLLLLMFALEAFLSAPFVVDHIMPLVAPVLLRLLG